MFISVGRSVEGVGRIGDHENDIVNERQGLQYRARDDPEAGRAGRHSAEASPGPPLRPFSTATSLTAAFRASDDVGLKGEHSPGRHGAGILGAGEPFPTCQLVSSGTAGVEGSSRGAVALARWHLGREAAFFTASFTGSTSNRAVAQEGRQGGATVAHGRSPFGSSTTRTMDFAIRGPRGLRADHTEYRGYAAG